MSQRTGPQIFYPLEATFECMVALHDLSLQSSLSLLEDGYERTWQLREFCTPLLTGVRHETEHFQNLDAHLSTLMPMALRQHPSQLSSLQINYDKALISPTEDILSRLPRLPQRLFILPFTGSGQLGKKMTFSESIKDGRWASKYILPEARSQLQLQSPGDSKAFLDLITNLQNRAWNNLFVTTYIDTNSIVLARMIAYRGTMPDMEFARDFLQYVNTIAELVDEYEELDTAAAFGTIEILSDPSASVQELKSALFPKVDDKHRQDYAVLKAFLWTVWQRSVMLYFYYITGVQFCQEYSSSWNALLTVRGIKRLDSLTTEDYRGDNIPYLCNWAFELHRATRSSLGLDFRRMLRRFDAHFKGRPGRCIKGSNATCRGDQPESCQRFTGAETKAQSAHGTLCDGTCYKVPWSEISYRESPSPQAVLVNGNLEVLQYCSASSHTLAITHVWSHGQGGRPETGINSCLHEQYCRLARDLNCKSYWIDSTCIPSYGPLRKEAIRNINSIFSNSKVTLVSDQDLQSIDLSSPSIDRLETLLSVLLVCDWNVRAWTMLEAIRGSGSIYLLCKNEKSISLQDVLRKVHKEGAIDMAILLGGAQHILPHPDSKSPKPVEEASYLLSRRHASRPDDEVIIWSLLSNGSGHKEALRLWKAQTQVRTAFLMSSAPRLEDATGFGWAPQCPYIRPHLRSVDLDKGNKQHYTVHYPSYDGQGSFCAQITENGLLGKWLVMDMDSTTLSSYLDDCYQQMPELLAISEDIQNLNQGLDIDTCIYTAPDEASACKIIDSLLGHHVEVRILRPLAEDGVTPYEGGSHRGEQFGLVSAICTSVDGGETWEWKGVYQWQDPSSFPRWKVEEMLIV